MSLAIAGPMIAANDSAGTQLGLTRISFGLGSDQETDQAVTLLRETDSIVLDTVALFTVQELGIIDLLRDRFGEVSLPQLVFDDLQSMAFNLEMMGQAPGFIGKTENGRYAISDIPKDTQQRWQEEVEAIRDFASSLELVPSYGLLDTPDVEQLLSTLTPAGAGTVWVGVADPVRHPLLVSDDLALSKVANAFGTNTVNTQALLLELHQSGILSNADYSRLVERLTVLNYWFVRVRAEDIISSFEAHGYLTTDGTRAMIRTLEGPDCLEDSAVSVAADLVVGLSSRTVPGQLDLILALVLSTLQHGRETSPVLSKFQEAIKNDPRLPPLSRQRILTSITSYHLGGMTRAGHGLIVLRH